MTSGGRYSGYCEPAASRAVRMAARRRFAVSPAVSRYTGTIRPTWSRSTASAALEVGALEHDQAVAVLDPAGHEDPVPRPDPALDELAAVPGGLRDSRCRPAARRSATCTRLRQVCSTLMSSTMTSADATVPSSSERRAPRRLHLAQVVIAAGQVEEELADGLDAQPPGRAPERRELADARLGERRREERADVGRSRHGHRRPKRPAGLRRGGPPALAHSAEIRYR